jgi:hypothetical protein
MTIRWRPHTERPRADESTTAIVAIRYEDGNGCYLYGFVAWRNGRWECEITSEPPSGEFWWLPEEDLLALVPSAAEQGDCHDHTH